MLVKLVIIGAPMRVKVLRIDMEIMAASLAPLGIIKTTFPVAHVTAVQKAATMMMLLHTVDSRSSHVNLSKNLVHKTITQQTSQCTIA